MAGQLPPDVLEDLMLIEAIDGPGDAAPELMPGGFDDVQADIGAEENLAENENVVNVNFVPAPSVGAARPQAEVGQALGDVVDDEQGDEDTDEDEEEEEYISVRTFSFTLLGKENYSFVFFKTFVADAPRFEEYPWKILGKEHTS